jgi:cob(I)alamin adenosyltransferase
MANRLSKITTRTGDDGSTGLGDGSRIQKSAPRVQVMGELDELNCHLGVLLAETLPEPWRNVLTRIQNHLFDLGGEISIPGFEIMTEAHLQFIDDTATQLNGRLPALKEFILPGGSRAAALAHVVRAVARRAERAVVALAAVEPVSPFAIPYLNRLSDFMFGLARQINLDAGVPDQCWTREAALAE